MKGRSGKKNWNKGHSLWRKNFQTDICILITIDNDHIFMWIFIFYKYIHKQINPFLQIFNSSKSLVTSSSSSSSSSSNLDKTPYLGNASVKAFLTFFGKSFPVISNLINGHCLRTSSSFKASSSSSSMKLKPNLVKFLFSDF